MIGAIVYELIALNSDSLPEYHGQQLHGLCFKILDGFSVAMAALIHQKMPIKPFTSADLEFSKSNRLRQNRRYIAAGDVVYWRVTALNEEVLQAFLSVRQGQVMSIGNLQLKVERIIVTPETRDDVGLVDPEDIMAECFSLPPIGKVAMEFRSVTSFRSGVNDCPWPSPELVFGSLADKWAAMDMPGEFSANLIREEARSLLICDWHGASRKVFLSPKRGATGFTGRFVYRLNTLPDDIQRIFLLLATYAEFSGVGRWTAHGLGQVRISL